MGTAAEDSRFIQIPGSLNFRDFGGYLTKDGRRIRRGHLFRSGMLTDIPASATTEFADLGIGVICDMRSHDEVALYPTPDSAAFDCQVHIPISPGTSQSLRASMEQMQNSATERVHFMREITREIAREHVAAYALVLRALVETQRGFLIHCMAGKDRTGFGAAVIKLTLGVSKSLIMHDYLLTNQASDLITRTRSRMKEQGHSIDESTLKIMTGVEQGYLEAALEEIDQHFGGLDGYLEAAEISQQDINHLKSRLLEQSP
jgi:protein-tyrosine phosphatase